MRGSSLYFKTASNNDFSPSQAAAPMVELYKMTGWDKVVLHALTEAWQKRQWSAETPDRPQQSHKTITHKLIHGRKERMEARIRSGCWDQEAALTRLCILCRTAACCCRSSGEKSRVSLISVRSCSSAINYLTQEFYKKIIWNSILLLSVKYFIIFEHFKSSVRVTVSRRRCDALSYVLNI